MTKKWSSTAMKIKSASNEKLWDHDAGLYRDNETTTLHPQDGNVWAVKSNLTQSKSQIASISRSLRFRWGKYGAPAPEAGTTVSPFISGIELQSHYLAGNANSALDLLRLEWGFMMDDPRMTNSTFIEGYSTDGSLVYAPYANSPRISHAHGWSTAPTSVLMNYAAGLKIMDGAGEIWRIEPQPGGLRFIDAGFTTVRGSFGIKFEAMNGTYKELSFKVPEGSKGDVILPGVRGTFVNQNGTHVSFNDRTSQSLGGGNWTLVPFKN